jgi:precorrin-2 methylase
MADVIDGTSNTLFFGERSPVDSVFDVLRTNEEWAKLQQRVKESVAAGWTVVFADNVDPLLFSPWGWVPQHLAESRPIVLPGISFNAGNAALRQAIAGLGSLNVRPVARAIRKSRVLFCGDV